MSMAASIEGRVPFLDHRLVELAATVPAGLKIRGGTTKFVLKHLARRHLPASIIDRRKAGFAVPVTAWLRRGGALEPYVDMLGEARTLQRGRLDRRALTTVVAEHRAGRRDHGELLWALINLELWQRMLIDAPAASARPVATAAVAGSPA